MHQNHANELFAVFKTTLHAGIGPGLFSVLLFLLLLKGEL